MSNTAIAEAPVTSTDSTEAEDTTSTTSTEALAPWMEKIKKSAEIKAKGDKANAKAGTLLWTASQEGITDWLGGPAETDQGGEGLYNTLVGLMGKSRRGDANKIKTVALAAKDKGLVLSSQKSLSKAYGEAKRLLDAGNDVHAADDHAAEEAVEAIAENVPGSTKTAEGAALIVLSKGLDEAARLLLDALNGPSSENNEAAHRALLRAVSQEIAGRRPKPQPKAASTEPKAGATKGKGKGSKAKAAPVKPNPKAPRQKVKAAQDTLPDDSVTEPVAEDAVVEETVVEAPVEKAKPVKAKPIIRRN